MTLIRSLDAGDAAPDLQDVADVDHAGEAGVELLHVAVFEVRREEEAYRGEGEHTVGDNAGETGLFGGFVRGMDRVVISRGFGVLDELCPRDRR